MQLMQTNQAKTRGKGGDQEMAPPMERRSPSLAESRQWTRRFLRGLGVDGTLPAAAELPAAYFALVRGVLSSAAVSVVPATPASPRNAYNTLHGGMVAAVAEAVGMACARAAAGDKEMFLGELSAAYLSAARLNSEVEVEAQILRKGRSVVVTTVEFRLKGTNKLCYTSRATFYIMPVASL
uniref:Thioesterase domain-containing protein n=1 Tax=Oryza barthii TaxID=65489 RepID=A0A0D3GQP5_9ORYZ